MEKRVRMWLKACLVIAGLLFFCFLAGRHKRGVDYEKEVRIKQYEADESVDKIETTLLAYGDLIQAERATETVPGDESGSGRSRVLTTDGIFTYETEETKDCMYKQVTAYVRDDVILEVVEAPQQKETILHNLWISEVEEGRILCYLSGNVFYLPCQTEKENREQVADVTMQDGEIRDCHVKKEKQSGKLLGITEETISLPGRELPIAKEVRVYRLYGELTELSLQDLPIGYENTDYVTEDGMVCACLITSEEKMETIRVLLQSGNYNGRYHESVELTADCAYTLEFGEEKESYEAGESVHIAGDSEYYQDSDRVFLTLSANTGRIVLTSIERNRERTEYRGSLEIVRTENGLAVINELLLEEYLYGVVPSEMPASYPEESLKAQAVCARTYAYRNMKNAGFPELGAHVDDSTAFQVYGNTEEKAETTAAVKATKGELLLYGDDPIDAYYYSTSCGYGTDTRAWNGMEAEAVPYLQARRIGEAAETEKAESGQGYTPEALQEEAVFAQFIREGQAGAFESEEAWYRWQYEVEQVDVEEMERRLAQRYEVQPGNILSLSGESYVSQPVGKIGTLQELAIIGRTTGGNAAKLLIEGSEGSYLIQTEYNIRYLLNNGKSQVVRQDGSQVASPTLLPSAFFMVTTGKEDGNVVGYTIVGGGYGHGIGMSQNGAKHMAKAGMTASEILSFFYDGSRIEAIY